MTARKTLVTAIITGLMAGWIPHGTAEAASDGVRMNATKKAYDLPGNRPLESSARANSLLTPQTIVLGKGFQGQDEELKALQKAYEEHKAKRRLDDVIVFVRHQGNAGETRQHADLVHARLPGVRVALMGAFPGKDLQAVADVYVPADAEIRGLDLKDCENLQRLRDCIEAVRRRKHQNRYAGLIRQAERMPAIRKGIVTGLKDLALDPGQLAAERKKLGVLLAKFVPLTKPYEKWDKGAMSLARAVEVRIARQTARRRKALRERHTKACEALKTKPLSQEEWDALWPKRVLFSQDFEGPPTKAFDWDGEIVTDNVPKGSKRALSGKIGNKYFARRTRTGIYYDNARATTTTWVTFDYFINKNVPIGVFVFSMTRGDNCRYTIPKPVVGKWTKVTLQVGGGRARIRTGEALDDVFIHAGKPGDTELKLIVDNVRLVGLD